jgi:hypothetical protein
MLILIYFLFFHPFFVISFLNVHSLSDIPYLLPISVCDVVVGVVLFYILKHTSSGINNSNRYNTISGVRSAKNEIIIITKERKKRTNERRA